MQKLLKTAALTGAVLVSLVPRSAPAAELLTRAYDATILRVIDGDTVEARVHIWLNTDITTHIRLRGIDAPELHGHCPGERQAAIAARDALARLLDNHDVEIDTIGVDKYGGRIDARLRLYDGTDIGAAMLKSGHAMPARRGRVKRC